MKSQACRDRVSEGHIRGARRYQSNPVAMAEAVPGEVYGAPDVSMRPRDGPKGGSRRSAQTPPLMAACEARR